MAGSGKAFPVASGSFDKYQAEDDHRTLQRAEEVRADPKRLSGVKKHHRKTMRDMTKMGKSLGGKR